MPVPRGISTVEVDLEGYGTVRDILWGMEYFGADRRHNRYYDDDPNLPVKQDLTLAYSPGVAAPATAEPGSVP